MAKDEMISMSESLGGEVRDGTWRLFLFYYKFYYT